VDTGAVGSFRVPPLGRDGRTWAPDVRFADETSKWLHVVDNSFRVGYLAATLALREVF